MTKLEQKQSELSEADLKGLRRSLGTRGRPYPMMGTTTVETEDGEELVVSRLGVLEDDDFPLDLWSERSYAEVLGIAYREMPTPGMLPVFHEAVRLRAPDSRRRVQFVKGHPGAGKSFMAKMIARMRTGKGALVIDCGDKNLSELLFETVLDFNRSASFYDELDERLANGTLHGTSLKMLEKALGPALAVEADGRASIDWALVGHSLTVEDGALTDHGYDEATMDKAIEVLKTVSRQEGLDNLGGNALGIRTQEGPLIRAWKEGREIILDEYNKSKEGTDGGLQIVLQFLAGEVDECTVENKLKEHGDDARQTFTFSRDDMRAGFFVTLTGNAVEDGVTTRKLSKSVNSRLEPWTIPVTGMEDWQHRICQIMTGVPVSTLFRAGEAQWRKDPDAFRRKLIELRKAGLSEEQQANIPRIQLDMLNQWQDVLEASARLAKFYHGWSQMVDPDSPLMTSPAFAELIQEVHGDDEYSDEIAVDFRRVIKDIEEAMRVKAGVTPVGESEGFDTGAWGAPPNIDDAPEEEPGLAFGTRLSEIILSKVNRTTIEVGKPKLHEHLMALAVNCGLAEVSLKEGVASNNKTVADLLNISPWRDRNPNARARLVQTLLCDWLRERSPDLTTSNDSIVTRTQVARALQALEDKAANDNAHDNMGNLIWLPNQDHRGLSSTPFVRVWSVDASPKPNHPVLEVAPDKLVDRDTMVAAIAMPGFGSLNIQQFFTRGLSGTGVTVDGQGEHGDEALKIAENRSATGLAITTIVTASDDGKGTSRMHVLHNSASGTTMIVGDAISARMRHIYRQAGIAWIDRGDARAKSRAEKALNELLRGRPEGVREQLKMAFMMRNGIPGPDMNGQDTSTTIKGMDRSLAELLVAGDVVTFLPHYMARRERPAGGPSTAGTARPEQPKVA